MKKLYEITYRKGHPIKVLVDNFSDALKAIDPYLGEVIGVALYDDNPSRDETPSDNKKELILRMPCPYGIAQDYQIKNECPYCQAPLANIRARQGCYDGEWTYIHNFDCSQNCQTIQYDDIIAYNNLKR